MTDKMAKKIKDGLCVIGFALAGAYLLSHDCPVAGTVFLVLAALSA